MKSRARALVLLALPLIAVPVLVARFAERQADRIASGLASASDALSSMQTNGSERDRELVTDWRAQLADLWDELAAAPRAEVEAPKVKDVPRRSSKGGIRVSADTVLRLANAGARPSGIFVSRAAGRPAGLMLLGVSGLGVGLKDGDILTHAAGQPATSEGQVVSLVLSARGARQPQIGGRVWRRGGSFPLVVDQPYLAPPPENSTDEERAKHSPIGRSDGTG